MPEGPEIRIAADRIAHVLQGERIEEVFFAAALLKSFKERLEGATVTRVDTHGKAMLTRFDNGLTLYSHNQLYGRWFVRSRGVLPQTNRSLRVALHTVSSSALLYSASDVDVLDAVALKSHPFLCRLGPDILSPALTWHAVSRRLYERQFRRRSLGSLYLDQSFLAGIGNYLRSEILYFAGLDYRRRPQDLSRSERQRLARQTLAVARRSYETAGITNPPARASKRKRAGNSDAERFAVFGRDGKRCGRCGGAVQRSEAGSRRIFFCSSCQK